MNLGIKGSISCALSLVVGFPWVCLRANAQNTSNKSRAISLLRLSPQIEVLRDEREKDYSRESQSDPRIT